ncbi:MAG TPA: nodulation protein NfeD [Acidimicrobiia bacterium]|nr:nodulation protein NfeD [Acidimicrobiia bacterium]
MRRRRRAVGGLIAGTALVAAFIAPVLAQGTSGVLVTEVDGPITPVIADHLAAAVEQALGEGALLVVTLDTPGGLDTSMRDIVQTFLNAPVPILVYVEPEGARAASAGTFITMAAHVAAMAPATSIGAATPVDLQDGEISDKIINDAVAFAISLAERRGRNVEFAESAVRDGTSITASQAVEDGVVDMVADDLDGLLSAIDGMTVEVLGEEVTLVTAGAVPDRYEMSTLRRILAQIADPNLAVLFLSIGTLAVVYEAANPGLGFAGVIGVILLLLGFFALSVLPVATAGLALLILAIALFIGEIFVPGVGVLAAGGTIALLLAGVFLFEGELQVSPPVLWPTALVLGAATTIAGRAALKARLRPSTTGTATLIGKAGTVVNVEGANGSVFLDGAWWSVRSSVGELEPGEQARVVGIEGLELIVEPIGADHEH